MVAPTMRRSKPRPVCADDATPWTCAREDLDVNRKVHMVGVLDPVHVPAPLWQMAWLLHIAHERRHLYAHLRTPSHNTHAIGAWDE